MSVLGRRELAGVVGVGLVAVGAVVTSPERTLRTLAGLGDRPLLFLPLLGAVYVLRPLVAWPVVAISAVAGFVLGPTLGFAVAIVGVAVTSVPPYAAARWFDAGTGLTGRVSERARAYFRTTGDVRGVVAARFVPVPSDAVSVAAGLSGVGVQAFVVGTVLGELPWTVAGVLVGASARELHVGGLSSVGLPLAVGTTVAAVALLAGPAYRALDGRPAGES